MVAVHGYLKVTHRLKGTSATVQAERINAIAVEIEAAGRAGQLGQLESQVAEVLLEFDNFRKVLAQQFVVGCPKSVSSPAICDASFSGKDQVG